MRLGQNPKPRQVGRYSGSVLLAMTYQERILQAASVKDAMVILGEGIDAILGDGIAGVSASEWEAWEAHDSEQEIRERLADEADPEERRALEARLRLLTDDGVVAQPVVPEGRRVITTGDAKQITVDIPKPSADRARSRYEWATATQLGGMLTPSLSTEEAADAYAKGGPMWLYLYDRDAVMSLPVEWRRAFVEDVERDSPAQAQEMGRDILKDRGTGGNPFA